MTGDTSPVTNDPIVEFPDDDDDENNHYENPDAEVRNVQTTSLSFRIEVGEDSNYN